MKSLATFAALTMVSVMAWAQAMADGEVRKVDTAQNKITIKHGEIKNLDMPPMSMVYDVKDPALLAKVKAGDKIKFSADKLNGRYTVTAIDVAR